VVAAPSWGCLDSQPATARGPVNIHAYALARLERHVHGGMTHRHAERHRGVVEEANALLHHTH